MDDEGFEVIDAVGPGLKAKAKAKARAPATKATRKSTRTKLPPIPKAASPLPLTEALGLNANHPSRRTVTGSLKRKRSISSASRSHTDSDERDELEEGPARKYKKPAVKKAAAGKGKAKGKGDSSSAEAAKPKKISMAQQQRDKLDQLRKDRHFGRLDEDTLKRIMKVSLERMYLIHRFRAPGYDREEFDVSGSTGNVYKVVLDRQVDCSCMDFRLRRQVCKHMLFVYIKVLRLKGHLPVYTQVRLSAEDLERVFEEALLNPLEQAVAKPDLRKAWETAVGYQPNDEEQASGSGVTEESTAPEGKRMLPEEGDVCGVCYEDLEPGSVEGLEFCLASCGRPTHTDCLATWFKTRGYDHTCIWCRAKWQESSHSQQKVDDRKAHGYGIGVSRRGAVVDASGRQLNLAAVAGVDDGADAEAAADPAADAGVDAQADDVFALGETDGWE
ncbi:Zinc finger, RING-type [Kalmanozyma brasiliensis GHG001]|uniref:SWIM-type domain-containing protein n=1 Tax=Kalmanozyma brasiliensis (strain GHG001) TaxID=1365824 RepID=V5EAR5_KALBG|nr:Zinc finger, RING-type [Kalmanozyma brasiliensis GHG001]EST07491.1 Zinc finger, RING-type [Kalmanozyma brasiliensis GHG001]